MWILLYDFVEVIFLLLKYTYIKLIILALQFICACVCTYAYILTLNPYRRMIAEAVPICRLSNLAGYVFFLNVLIKTVKATGHVQKQ